MVIKKLDSTLNLINFILSIFVLVLAIFILAFPFMPEVTYQVEAKLNRSTFNEQDIQQTNLDENRLFIPKIGVNGIIYESDSKEALDKGIWRKPNSSSPDQGSNTVLLAHRFMYSSGGDTFYHLDKLQIGDQITVNWNKQLYNYKVFEIKEVFPDQIDIEAATDNSILTLYTCTPLFTASKRLVVIAKPI